MKINYKLITKPSPHNFDKLYIVEDENGTEVLKFNSQSLRDNYYLLSNGGKSKQKLIERFRDAHLTEIQKNAVEFLVNETYEELSYPLE